MARKGRIGRRSRIMTSPRRWVAWWAVFALVAQTLLPFGQVLAFDPSQDVEYQFICTANGIKQVSVDDNGVPEEAQDSYSCPFCFTYAEPAMVQPDAVAIQFAEHVRDQKGAAHLTDALRVGIWRGAPPPSRAPPLHV